MFSTSLALPVKISTISPIINNMKEKSTDMLSS